jgi:hypothetical protein
LSPHGTRCAGINYSNNELFVFSPAKNRNQTVFDEAHRYLNVDQPKACIPLDISFSAANARVTATTDEHIIRSASENTGVQDDETSYAGRYVLVSHLQTAFEKRFPDRELIGWVGDRHVRVRPYTAVWQGYASGAAYKSEVLGRVVILDVVTGEEAPFFDGDRASTVQRIDINWTVN